VVSKFFNPIIFKALENTLFYSKYVVEKLQSVAVVIWEVKRIIIKGSYVIMCIEDHDGEFIQGNFWKQYMCSMLQRLRGI
jgi:hypothetical protein